MLYFTPVMSARSIVVVGTGAVTHQAGPRRRTGRLGTPLLQINTDAVADRVAGSGRWPAHASAQYPSALRITIAERIPLVVRTSRTARTCSTATASISPPPAAPGLPYLDVDNPGPRIPPTKAALEVLTALRPGGHQVGRIAAPSVASITLTLADSRTVV